ncbi:hypothetical protein MKY89_25535 [Bacillus sp. FSL W7-1294]
MMKKPVNEASYFLCRSTDKNMIEKFMQALQRMQDVMIPIYNFISAIADLNINF